MDVILLERVAKLGQLGEIVTVKNGYARNFLLPQGKALRATKANKAQFEAQKAQLEARNEEMKGEAATLASTIDGAAFVAVRQASDAGMLYGSVSNRDIVEMAAEKDFTLTRAQVEMPQPIKALGIHEVILRLHPEVTATVTVNVARSEEEAERQAAGEDILAREEDELDIELDQLFSGDESVYEREDRREAPEGDEGEPVTGEEE
ncbi:MAG: 50S ribosomal protein L9 [Pseudomonadota bacterium]